MNSLIEEFVKENLSIISDLLETNEFDNLLINLAIKFKIPNFKTRWMKYFLKNFSFMMLNSFYIFTPPLFFLNVVGLTIINIALFNRVRLNDYFNDIRNDLDRYKNDYKNKIKIIKKKFIEELDNLEAISLKEIEYLNKRNFHLKFNTLMKKILQ